MEEPPVFAGPKRAPAAGCHHASARLSDAILERVSLWEPEEGSSQIGNGQ